MSKRDKDKAIRSRVRGDDGAMEQAVETGVSGDEYTRWLGDKARQLPADALRELARRLDVSLPEIDVDDFRRSGYLPQVLTNYLALLGWNPGVKNADGTDLERFGMEYLASHFSIERVGKKPSKFDRDKLRAFNADTIQKEMSAPEFAAAWRAWLERYERATLERIGERLDMAARAVQPRATTLADAIDPIRFAIIPDDAVAYDAQAAEKVLLKNDQEGLRALSKLEGVIARVEPFEPEAIEGAVKAWCADAGVGMGKAAQPLRVAVTGGTVSPGLGETLALVGKDGVLARIRRCVEAHGG